MSPYSSHLVTSNPFEFILIQSKIALNKKGVLQGMDFALDFQSLK